MKTQIKRAVVFLPGIITPAPIVYRPVVDLMLEDMQPLLKELEVYAADDVPDDYSLDAEVEALRRAADDTAWDEFHLVGYSGGGGVALAFTAAYPQRVRSLALVEPAVIPSPEWLAQETEFWDTIRRSAELPPEQQGTAFFRAQVQEDVVQPPPPAGDPPPWMAKRPAGIKGIVRAFTAAAVPMEQFRAYRGPVYLAVGGRSNPIEQRKGALMQDLFTDFQMEVYSDRHHFDPPHAGEPERFADALRQLWQRAEARE